MLYNGDGTDRLTLFDERLIRGYLSLTAKEHDEANLERRRGTDKRAGQELLMRRWIDEGKVSREDGEEAIRKLYEAPDPSAGRPTFGK